MGINIKQIKTVNESIITEKLKEIDGRIVLIHRVIFY